MVTVFHHDAQCAAVCVGSQVLDNPFVVQLLQDIHFSICILTRIFDAFDGDSRMLLPEGDIGRAGVEGDFSKRAFPQVPNMLVWGHYALVTTGKTEFFRTQEGTSSSDVTCSVLYYNVLCMYWAQNNST